MLRMWLVRTSPLIGKPRGRTMLVGNGRTRDVIGQTTAKPVFSVKAAGETTRAGRRPACSRPLVGSKSVQIRSPVSGKYSEAVIPRRSRDRHQDPNQRLRHSPPATLQGSCRETVPPE